MASDLAVTDLVKVFTSAGTHDAVVALDHLSLTIEDGSVVGVVGSNGAGKSTLLSVVSGSQLADAGRVEVAGRDVTRMPSWRRAQTISRVQQNPELSVFVGLTIEENFALRLAGERGAFGLGRARRRSVRVLATEELEPFGMGLEDRLDTLCRTLSGGQRQAVAVAISTVVRPRVLLLDEHVAALDPMSARLVLEETSRIVREHHITTLMVTHDMATALHYSDRLLMLNRGRIVLDLDAEAKRMYDVAGLVELFSRETGETLSDQVLLESSGEPTID